MMKYICANCNGEFLGWSGKCPNCGQWGTLEEYEDEKEIAKSGSSIYGRIGSRKSKKTGVDESNVQNYSTLINKIRENERNNQLLMKGKNGSKFSNKQNSKSGESLFGSRMSSGYEEFDRVLGGGFVGGEVLLLSGEPGVGKSTLLLQVALKQANCGKVLYVSCEESIVQLSQRIERVVVGIENGTVNSEGKVEVKSANLPSKMNISKSENNKSYVEEDEGNVAIKSVSKRSSKGALYRDNLYITEASDIDEIVDLIESLSPTLVIVDSIQAVTSSQSRGFPGSMSQVRICGSVLTKVAKANDIPVVMVGQINKEGFIAGPKILEHMVDCVIYIEGEEFNIFRIVRGIKNRFGATNEIGVFEMSNLGMKEVSNPSQVFLEGGDHVPGCAIGAVIKGSRVVFVEVQALTVDRDMSGGPLRRVANGIKKPRLDMLCAVLSRRGKIFLGDKDVFVNIVGGLNLDDPVIDLAVCAAIKSVVKDKPIDRKTIFVGEVGLSGEIRSFMGYDAVKKEATRLGYEKIVSRASGDKRISDI